MIVWVDDVDALYEEFKERVAEIRQPPTKFPWGMREMQVEWAENDRQFREMVARREQRRREWDEILARRRARLRRVTFGLLGR